MANIFDMTDTWTAVGTTYTGIKLNVTDTASAAASLLMDLQVGGVSLVNVRKDGLLSTVYLRASAGLAATSNSQEQGIMFGAAFDTFFGRDAANILAMRNGANAQEFRLYNTYTDGSNYERLAFVTGAAFEIQVQNAGTGAAKSLQLKGGSSFYFGAGGAVQWHVNTSGDLLAVTDNASDIGASGATRPRTAYLGTSLFVGTTKVVGVQGAAVADATDAATAITQLNALLARVRAHGLIAT